MFLISALLALYIVLVAVRKYQANLYGQFVELSNRSLDSARAMLRRKQRAEELERLKPKLYAIQQRLLQFEQESSAASMKMDSTSGAVKGLSTSDGTHSDISSFILSPKHTALSFDQDSGKIIYQAGRLFDILDRDGNGILDFEELQLVLELNPQQLQAFAPVLTEPPAAFAAEYPEKMRHILEDFLECWYD
jgi:hypothetical protein